MKAYMIILTLFLFNPSLQAQAVQDSLLTSYLGIKNALVSGKQGEASHWAQALLVTLENSNSQKGNSNFTDKLKTYAHDLTKNATIIHEQKDIEKQRKAFAELSLAYWPLLKATEEKQSLFYDYCPMKKSYWISTEATIQNPYYGSKMLNCGKVAEKIN